MFSVQKHSLALRSPLLNPADLFPYHSLTGSTQQEWRAGQRRGGRGREGKGGAGRGREGQLLCVLHIPCCGPGILRLSPSGDPEGKEVALSPNGSLGLISFLLLPVRRRCDCLSDSLKTRRRTRSRNSLLQAVGPSSITELADI